MRRVVPETIRRRNSKRPGKVSIDVKRHFKKRPKQEKKVVRGDERPLTKENAEEQRDDLADDEEEDDE